MCNKLLELRVQLVMGCPSEMLPVPLALKVRDALPSAALQVPTKGLVVDGGGVVPPPPLPLLLQPIIPTTEINNTHKHIVFAFFIDPYLPYENNKLFL